MYMIRNLYKEHSFLTDKILDELLLKDIWLTSEECLEYGLVDYII